MSNKKFGLGILAMVLTFGMAVTGCDTGNSPVIDNRNGENAPKTFTVTFNSNGGSDVQAISGIVYNSTIILPSAPTRGDNAFSGWFTDNNTFLEKFTSSTLVTENITVFARWKDGIWGLVNPELIYITSFTRAPYISLYSLIGDIEGLPAGFFAESRINFIAEILQGSTGWFIPAQTWYEDDTKLIVEEQLGNVILYGGTSPSIEFIKENATPLLGTRWPEGDVIRNENFIIKQPNGRFALFINLRPSDGGHGTFNTDGTSYNILHNSFIPLLFAQDYIAGRLPDAILRAP